MLSKIEPISIFEGFGDSIHDSEGRCLTIEFANYFLDTGLKRIKFLNKKISTTSLCPKVNTYVPNAGAGLKRLEYRTKSWDPDFRSYLKELSKDKQVIIAGDLNGKAYIL